MDKNINILLTAAGSPVFIPICKSLKSNKNLIDRGLKIHTCDMNPEAIGLKIADSHFIVPPGNSPYFISKVLSYCKENDIDLLIPAADEELLPLSKNIDKFLDIGCKVLVSDKTVLKSIQNKSYLYNTCYNIGMGDYVPEFGVCTSSDSFKSFYSIISKNGHKVCVKPAFSHGSRGFRVFKDLPTKSDFFNKKPDPRSITYKNFLEIIEQDKESFPPLLVMEYLPGEEYSVDCLYSSGEFYCVTRRRDVIKEGICSSGTAIKKDDLIEAAKTLYTSLGINYNANIQFRYDKNNQPKILEINPRVAGTMELCRGAGVDFVSLAVNEILGFPQQKFTIDWGIKMTRVYQEIFHDSKILGDGCFTLESIGSVLK